MDPEVLLHGGIILVFLWLLLGSVGFPLPEDIALLSAGVLIHRGAVSPAVALIVAYVGVLGGDTTLFFLGRRYGMQLPLMKRLLPPPRRARVEAAYRRYGGRLVFFARYVGGLRAAVYALAGIHRMRPRRFIAFDATAVAFSVPLVVGIGYVGARNIELVIDGVATIRHYALLTALGIVLGLIGWRRVRRPRATRARSPDVPSSASEPEVPSATRLEVVDRP